MLKMQHPEYEMFTADSTHYSAGVACADCHMPYTSDGAAKFSNHNIQSPLLNPDRTCGTCHTDVSYVVGRVANIQQQTRDAMVAAENALVDSIEAIQAATAAGDAADAQRLAEARSQHRTAQAMWDFVAAENSMGFHNPEEALRILGGAADLARQAQLNATLALPGQSGGR
jgi:nitrite reductase (cytochrome c-552)